MLRPQFYSFESDGVTVRDWVAQLAAGEAVADVHCGDCTGLPEPEAAAAEGAEATGGG